MLKYLIVLLDESAPSFCHYAGGEENDQRNLISIGNLEKAVRFAMMENLNVQFVWPDYMLPEEYLEVMDRVDHINIVPVTLSPQAEVVVCHKTGDLKKVEDSQNVVLRCSLQDLVGGLTEVKDALVKAKHLSVVLSDLDSWSDHQSDEYRKTLVSMSKFMVNNYAAGVYPQLNLLTDRLFLAEMNNCNAGVESVTVGPDGCFYACPAFYYFPHRDSKLGSLESGLDIRNPQLYDLLHAPICSHCDAWQCRRCIWLNKLRTREVNTPGRMQCVSAHIEREASGLLKQMLENKGIFGLAGQKFSEIRKIDYIDPFEKRREWQ